MKKTTRTARKVLSVFLSVLMILTTLTVAVPGIALAAGSYYVRVYLNIYDGSDGYADEYSVESSTGKPKNYSWTTSDGYWGRINMTGMTLFYNGGYQVYDLEPELKAAETTLGNNYSDMDDLTIDNMWTKSHVEEIIPFTVPSIPTELFWINDDDNWTGANTGFAITKITVAANAAATETVIWQGLSGSESETYNYYGTISPTGVRTPWNDDPDENAKAFYKNYTTSSSGIWTTTSVPTSVVFDSPATINYTIPRMDANDSGSKYTRPAKVYDQYGVAMDVTPTSYYITDANGNKVNSSALYNEGNVFYIKKETQQLNPGVTTPVTYYLVADYNGITGRIQLNLTNPVYDVTYYNLDDIGVLFDEGVYGESIPSPKVKFYTQNDSGTHYVHTFPAEVMIQGDTHVRLVAAEEGHNLSYSNSGATHSLSCSECGYTATGVGHNWVAGTTVPSTCTVQGYTNYSCACGATKMDNYQPLADHKDTDNDHNCNICGGKVSECADNNNDHKCDICDATLSDCADANNDHKCDTCGDKLTDCADNNNDHNCDTCGNKLTNCADNNNDHKCDVCGETLSGCADNNNDHNCDTCGDKLTDCADANNDHKCDVCDATLSECADNNNDHNCDTCGDKLTDCADTDNDHNCDTCGTALSECADADNDNDHDCDICGKEDVTNHAFINPVLTQRPTENADGTWNNGTYTSTCNCGDTKTEAAVRAEYTELDRALAELEAYLDNEQLTDAVKEGIKTIVDGIKDGTYDKDLDGDGENDVRLDLVKEEQDKVDTITGFINELLAEIKNDLENDLGQFTKPDFSEIITEWEAYLSLVETYGGEVTYGTEGDSLTATVTKDGYIKDATAATVNGGFNDLLEIMNDPEAIKKENQEFINDVKDQLVAINAGIVDGTLRDPNFEAYDAQVKIYNEETSTVNVSAEDAQAVADAMAIVNAIKLDPDSTAKDNDATIAAQAAIIKAVNDRYADCAKGNHDWLAPVLTTAPAADAPGEYTYTCDICGETKTVEVELAEYTELDKAVEQLENIKNSNPDLTDDAVARIDEAIQKAEDLDDNLPADVKDGDSVVIPGKQDVIDDLAAELEQLVTEIETGIDDETLLKPDFSAWDEAINEYDGLDLENVTVKQSAIDDAEALRAEVNGIYENTEATKEEYQPVINADTSALEEIIAGILDGSLLEPDYSEAYEAIGNAEGMGELLTPEEVAKLEALKAQLEALEADETTNARDHQDDINETRDAANEIYNKYVDCNVGNHNWLAWVLTEKPGVGTPGKYTRTCDTCGATEFRYVGREDYTAYDAAVDRANGMLASDKYTAEAEALIEAALEEAAKLDQNLPADLYEQNGDLLLDNNNDVTIKAATDVLNAVLDSIANDTTGAYEKVDFTGYNAAVDAYESLKDKMSDEDKAKVEAAIQTVTDANITADTSKADGQETLNNAADAIAAINAKYVNCADGHAWGAPVLTKKPTTDTKGEYTETCENCGATQITKVDLADYREFNTAVEALKELAKTENLTDTAANAIADALNKAEKLDKNLPADATRADGTVINGGQETINSLVDELKQVVADTNAAITDGSALKPDYEAWETAEGTYDSLDKTNVKAEIAKEANDLKAEIAEKQGNTSHTQATATQDDIDKATARLNEIIAGINDGSLIKPADYSNWIAAENTYDAFTEEQLKNVDAETLEEVANLKNTIDALEADPSTNADDQQTIDDAAERLNEIIAEIDAILTEKPDFTEWKKAEESYDALTEDQTKNVKDDILKEVSDLKAEIEAIENNDDATKLEYQDDIDDAADRLDDIIAGIIDGTLRDPDYSEVEEKLEEANNAENLNKEAQDKIDAIEEALQEIKDKTDPEANAKDDQDDVKALEDQLDEILDAIADGSALKPHYSAWDAAEGTYDALNKTNAPESLVNEATNLKTTINALKNDSTANVEAQPTIDEATARLNAIITEINAAFAEKPNFDGYDNSHDTYEELVKTYGDKIKDSVATEVSGLDAVVEAVRSDETATKLEDQSTIDNAKTALDAIITGIENGTLRDPDYSQVEEKLEEINKVDGLTEEAQDKIDDIAETLQEIKDKKNPEANYKDDQQFVDILEEQLDEILEAIEDGSALVPDYEAWEEAEGTYDALDKTLVKDEIIAEANALKDKIAKLEANDTLTQATATQDDIDDATARLNEIIAGINDGSLIKPADYSEVDKALADAKEKAENNDVTDGVKDAIKAIEDELNELKNDSTINAGDQDEIDSLEQELENIITGIENGSLVKPDYEAWEEAEGTYDALDKTNVKSEIITEAEALKAEIAGKQADTSLTQATATQDDIDNATKRLNEIITGIENGTLKKPADYTEVDKDLADAKDKAENNDVINGVKEEIQAIEDELNELKNDPTTSADDQNEINALEKELESIIAGIDDGSLVKPDYTDADDAIENAENGFDGGKLSDEDKAALDELKEKLDEIKNDPTSNVKDDQGAVDGIKDKVQVIVDKYNACANGSHTYKTSETAPTCTEDGYKLHVCELCGKSYKEAGDKAKGHAELTLEAKEPTCAEEGLTEGKYCGVCGEILVAQQEIAKLPHTDADDDGVCDNCHNSGLYDGCVCLCHNDHWFWHLVYLIIRIIWRVFKIHPVCACGRIHF